MLREIIKKEIKKVLKEQFEQYQSEIDKLPKKFSKTTTKNVKIGDRVRLIQRPEWGIGKIIEVRPDGVDILWKDEGIIDIATYDDIELV